MTGSWTHITLGDLADHCYEKYSTRNHRAAKKNPYLLGIRNLLKLSTIQLSALTGIDQMRLYEIERLEEYPTSEEQINICAQFALRGIHIDEEVIFPQHYWQDRVPVLRAQKHPAQDPHTTAQQQKTAMLVRHHLGACTFRQADTIRMLYGIDCEEKSLQQVAKYYNKTPATICNWRAQAFEMLEERLHPIYQQQKTADKIPYVKAQVAKLAAKDRETLRLYYAAGESSAKQRARELRKTLLVDAARVGISPKALNSILMLWRTYRTEKP